MTDADRLICIVRRLTYLHKQIEKGTREDRVIAEASAIAWAITIVLDSKTLTFSDAARKVAANNVTLYHILKNELKASAND